MYGHLILYLNKLWIQLFNLRNFNFRSTSAISRPALSL